MVLGHFGRWSKFKYVNLLILRSKVTADTIFSVFSILQQFFFFFDKPLFCNNIGTVQRQFHWPLLIHWLLLHTLNYIHNSWNQKYNFNCVLCTFYVTGITHCQLHQLNATFSSLHKSGDNLSNERGLSSFLWPNI